MWCGSSRAERAECSLEVIGMGKPKYRWWGLKAGGDVFAVLRFDGKAKPTADDFDDIPLSAGVNYTVVPVTVKETK